MFKTVDGSLQTPSISGNEGVTTDTFTLTQPPLVDGYVLTSDDAGAGTWQPSAAGATTASNVGLGAPVFKQKVGNDLEFNSVLGEAANLSTVLASDTITLDLTDKALTPGTYGDAVNVPQIAVDQKGRISTVNNVVLSAANLQSDRDLVVFVSKSGNDANGGRRVEDAKLTIGAAVTTAAALAPSVTNRVTVMVLDAGRYNLPIVLQQYIDLYAPLAELFKIPAGPVVTCSGNNRITAFKVNSPSPIATNCFEPAFDGTGPVYIDVTEVNAVGSNSIFALLSHSPSLMEWEINVRRATVVDGAVITVEDSFGLTRCNARIQNMVLSGASSSGVRDVAGVANIVRLDCDKVEGSGTAFRASGVGGNTVYAIVKELGSAGAWSTSTGMRLVIQYHERAGTTSGDLVSFTRVGARFGSIWAENEGAGLVLTNQSQFYQYAQFEANGTSTAEVTPDFTNNHVAVARLGVYMITCSGMFECLGGAIPIGDEIEIEIQLNNGSTRLFALHTGLDIQASTQRIPFAITGLETLFPNDTVELWVRNVSSAGSVARIRDCNLSVVYQSDLQ